MAPTKSNLTAIYAFSDSERVVRYVGKTRNPAVRFREHIRNAKTGVTPLYCWLNREVEAGRPVTWSVLEWVPEAEWAEAECRLIARHRASGRLLNVTDGGNAPVNAYVIGGQKRRVAEMKRALLGALRDKTMSDEFKGRLRAKMRLAGQLYPAMLGKWAAL